jgi:hypothetical protein
MWIFLLSDTFIFSCFLVSYMTVRMSTRVPWPNPSKVFALTIGHTTIPLTLIAIMTFILISSSGTMAMAVNYGYRHDRVKSAALMLVTAAFGATFVGILEDHPRTLKRRTYEPERDNGEVTQPYPEPQHQRTHAMMYLEDMPILVRSISMRTGWRS